MTTTTATLIVLVSIGTVLVTSHQHDHASPSHPHHDHASPSQPHHDHAARPSTCLPCPSRDSSVFPLLMRTETTELRISRLATRVDDMRQKLHGAKKEAHTYREKFFDLKDRIDELEGTGCSPAHFQCGGVLPRCISNILVCDDNKDCSNGHDEDESVCADLVPAGAIFEAILDPRSDNCTKRKPEQLRMLITSVSKADYFKSRVVVRAHITIQYHKNDVTNVEVIPVHGYYDYAKRALMLMPPESDGLGITCFFRGHRTNHCHASIVRQATMDSCANFILYNKDGRDGDDYFEHH